MKIIRQNMNGILVCLFELLVGILLLINPVGFTSGIIIAFGVVMILAGIANAVKYFRIPAEEAAASKSLMKGMFAFIIGCFCTFKSRWFIASFSILTMIYGVGILFTGIGKIQWAVDMFRFQMEKWFLVAISSAISIICGAVIVANPFTSTAVLWMFAGISLVIEAFFDIVTLFLGIIEANQNSEGREDKEL